MKKILLALGILLLGMMCVGAHAQTTTLAVDPASYTAPSVGYNFNVSITISDVTDLYGFDFTLGYNTTLLTATNITVGDFFPDSFIWKKDVNDTAGQVRFLVTRALGMEGGLSGSGTIAVASFTSDAEGETDLDLHDTTLDDSFAEHISHDVVDGEVMVVPEFPSYLLVPILVFATLLIAVLSKTRHPKKPRNSR
jgi:hypothetical protein